MEEKRGVVLLDKKAWPPPPVPGLGSGEVSENVFLFAKTFLRLRAWLRRRRRVGDSVRVLHHHEGNSWWAESPDVKGWSAAGDSFPEVVRLAEEGIPLALKREAELQHYVPAAT
jgi:predicted RNase H-like HicB family nuclease